VPEDEFVEIDLELRLAHSVVGADQPFLEVSNGAIGKWDRRLRAFTEFGSQRLIAGDMFEPGFRETLKALEAVRVDGRAGATFWVRKGMMVLALKSGITCIRTRPEALPRFSTATRTSAARRPLSCRLPRRPACSPANPRFINFDLAV
jgi:hypothetical protein